MERLRLRGVHDSMMSRCFDENDKDYPRYGGRGITVDERLLRVADYIKWFRQTFGLCDLPDGWTVDRIENDGTYTPENLRLATYKQQNNNKRNNSRRKTLSIHGWASKLGMHHSTLADRLNGGWSIEDALGKPARPKRNPTAS